MLHLKGSKSQHVQGVITKVVRTWCPEIHRQQVQHTLRICSEQCSFPLLILLILRDVKQMYGHSQKGTHGDGYFRVRIDFVRQDSQELK